MSKLKWNEAGKRFYEAGVSNAVLYPMDNAGDYPLGVAWSGLINVTESPEGAEANPLYADNIKYLNLKSKEDFKASIEAYTYPDEFNACQGIESLDIGILIAQQARTSFGLAYKTRIGNDVDDDLGYKIHIVYGADVAPSEKNYQSDGENPEAMTLSWDITTTPVAVTGKQPTATLVIDSRTVDPADLTAIEDALFGTDVADPYLPKPDALLALLP